MSDRLRAYLIWLLGLYIGASVVAWTASDGWGDVLRLVAIAAFVGVGSFVPLRRTVKRL